MTQQNIRKNVAKSLLLLYFGQMLLLLASLFIRFFASDGMVPLLIAVFTLTNLLMQLYATRRLSRLVDSQEYHMAFYSVSCNAVCWGLTLLGVGLYNFVQILSVVCEISGVLCLCRGTRRLLRGFGYENTSPSLIGPAYLLCAVFTYLPYLGTAAGQSTQAVVQMAGLLVCLAFALYLRQAARFLFLKNADDQN
ncbi:MAG: hypothetical protein VB023_10600 [Oscillibacter sp.]|nr:hypothetical protein [Oscillibacter sp.]